MELSKNELAVLKLCDEEPGNITALSKELRMPLKKIKKILNNLKEKKLVYIDKEIKGGLWIATLAGSKKTN